MKALTKLVITETIRETADALMLTCSHCGDDIGIHEWLLTDGVTMGDVMLRVECCDRCEEGHI